MANNVALKHCCILMGLYVKLAIVLTKMCFWICGKPQKCKPEASSSLDEYIFVLWSS